MKHPVAILSAFLIIVTLKPAAADTFQCLDGHGEPVAVISGDQGYGKRRIRMGSGGSINAQGALFLQQTDPPPPDTSDRENDYRVDLRSEKGANVCWAGGTIHNTNPA